MTPHTATPHAARTRSLILVSASCVLLISIAAYILDSARIYRFFPSPLEDVVWFSNEDCFVISHAQGNTSTLEIGVPVGGSPPSAPPRRYARYDVVVREGTIQFPDQHTYVAYSLDEDRTVLLVRGQSPLPATSYSPWFNLTCILDTRFEGNQ